MVLQHVAELPNLVVIRPAAFDTDGFSNGNLHMIDTARIPLGIDEAVRETHHQ